MDILVHEIDKGIARECLKKHNAEKGIEYYDKYTNFLKTQIEVADDKDFFKSKLKNMGS